MKSISSKIIFGSFLVAFVSTVAGRPLVEKQQQILSHKGNRKLYSSQAKQAQSGNARRREEDMWPTDDYWYEEEYYGKSGKRGKKGYSSKGGKGGKKGKKGKKSSKSSSTSVDEDDDILPPTRVTVSLTGEAFAPEPLSAIAPDPTSPNPLDVGAVYTFGNWTYNPQDLANDQLTVFVDGVPTTVWSMVDGLCTRTGTDSNTVDGYCHFSYAMYDPVTSALLGSFTTAGIISNPCETMTVTGGSGIFIATTGLVEVCGAVLDTAFTPPLVKSIPTDDDIFEDTDGYLHTFELALDEEFLLAVSV